MIIKATQLGIATVAQVNFKPICAAQSLKILKWRCQAIDRFGKENERRSII